MRREICLLVILSAVALWSTRPALTRAEETESDVGGPVRFEVTDDPPPSRSATAGQAPAEDQVFGSPGVSFLGPESRWSVTLDFLTWNRTGAPSLPLLRTYQGTQPPTKPAWDHDYTGAIPPSTGPILLTPQDFDFGFEFGPRLSVARTLSNGMQVEFSGFGFNHWTDTRNVTADNGVQFDAPGGAASVAWQAPAVFSWASRLYSAELNLRWFETPWLNSLIGVRWAQFDEQFSVDFPGGLFPSPGFWASQTTNQLVGGQLGADVRLWDLGGLVAVSGNAKAGLYWNREEQQSALPGSSGQTHLPYESVQARRDAAAFIGEAGLITAWRITDRLAGRVGYQVLWLSGVAQAPSQIPVSNISAGVATVQGNTSVLCHGVTFGLELGF